jgi:hypothetical protein
MDLLAVGSNGLANDRPITSTGVNIVEVNEITAVVSNGAGTLATEIDIEQIRGDNKTHRFSVQDENGDALSIVGNQELKFTVKKDRSLNAPIIFQLTKTGSGIAEVDAANGIYDAKVQPLNTNTLDESGYVYDTEWTDAADEIHTVAYGTFCLIGDVS